MAKRKKATTRSAVHTLFVRGFPRELTRQVRAAALLRGVTINEMLAILVGEALAHYRPAPGHAGVWWTGDTAAPGGALTSREAAPDTDPLPVAVGPARSRGDA